MSKVEESLLDSFAKDVAAQATRLDDLAKQLITLNLAIPGIYAAVLKLLSGDKAVLAHSLPVVFAFSFWLLALGLSLSSLLPQRYEIDPDNLDDIRAYFSGSARRKLIRLSIASFSCFAGIGLAVLNIFI